MQTQKIWKKNFFIQLRDKPEGLQHQQQGLSWGQLQQQRQQQSSKQPQQQQSEQQQQQLWLQVCTLISFQMAVFKEAVP